MIAPALAPPSCSKTATYISAIHRHRSPRSNSEIYNHRYIRDNYLAGVDVDSASDSVVPGLLYQKLGATDEIWNLLDGIFACVIYDGRTGEFVAARDPIGICSLYWGKGADGSTWFASELKALQDNCVTFDYFPPVSDTCR